MIRAWIRLTVGAGTQPSTLSFLLPIRKLVPSSTTPFDMRVQHQIDRFNLVKDAIMHLPQLGNKGSFLIQKMNDKLVEHKQYIAEYGQDLEEIRNWEWHK